MPKHYATCDTADLDTATQTCSAVVWVEDASGWLPELSAQDGANLGMAFFGLMAVAYLLRKARRSG